MIDKEREFCLHEEGTRVFLREKRGPSQKSLKRPVLSVSVQFYSGKNLIVKNFIFFKKIFCFKNNGVNDLMRF